jgi:stalled ribosome alternative rescue factor ArfA
VTNSALFNTALFASKQEQDEKGECLVKLITASWCDSSASFLHQRGQSAYVKGYVALPRDVTSHLYFNTALFVSKQEQDEKGKIVGAEPVW